MSSPLYLAVLGSPLLQQYLSAFSGATGILLHCLPSDISKNALSLVLRQDLFMALVMRSREGETAFLDPILALTADLHRKLKPAKKRNMCGLIHIGVPLIAGGSTAGMLLAGPIAKTIPNTLDCERIRGQIINWGLDVPLRAIRTAYRAVPVLGSSRLKSVIILLSLLADQLAVNRWLLADRERDPQCVQAAKHFIQEHSTDLLTLERVARHVCLSADHVGKIFKKSTQMSICEYISRIRVEHVKQMLPGTSCWPDPRKVDMT